MRHCSQFFLLLFFCVVTSCTKDTTKDEWARDSEPVGVMYFDGVEFREYGYVNTYYSSSWAYYGGLKIETHRSGFGLVYVPRHFWNKAHTIEVNFYDFYIDGSIIEKQEGRLIYSQGDHVKPIYVAPNNKGFCEVTTAELVFTFTPEEDAAIIDSEEDNAIYFNIFIEYRMEIIDFKGEKHDIEGWAIYNSERLSPQDKAIIERSRSSG